MVGRRNAYTVFLRQMKGKGMKKQEIANAFHKLSVQEKKKLQSELHLKVEDTLTDTTFRIRVFWEGDNKWYEGICHTKPGRKKVYIKYDDGDCAYIKLDNLQWEKIDTEHPMHTTHDNADEAAAHALLLTQIPRDSKANFIIELILKKWDSDAICQLVQHMTSNMTTEAKNCFFTSVCSMENPNYELLGNMLFMSL